jgi:hypothetical protein
MADKSPDPQKPGASRDAQSSANEPRKEKPMLPAGPHSEPHLTNPDATPGTGSLPEADHESVETDPGGG